MGIGWGLLCLFTGLKVGFVLQNGQELMSWYVLLGYLVVFPLVIVSIWLPSVGSLGLISLNGLSIVFLLIQREQWPNYISMIFFWHVPTVMLSIFIWRTSIVYTGVVGLRRYKAVNKRRGKNRK